MSFNWINANTYFYIPIIVFCAIMLITVIVGFINGWAVSAYFLIGQLVFFAIGIGFYSLIFSVFQDQSSRFIPVAIKEILGDTTSLLAFFKSPFGVIYMFLIEFIGFIFLVIGYIFFRKHLKKSHYIITNFDKAKPKLSSRLWGVGIASMTGLMIAAPLTTVAYVATVKKDRADNSILYKGSNFLVEKMSFGLYKNLMSIQKLVEVLSFAQNKDFQRLVNDIISGNTKNMIATIKNLLNKDNYDKIQSFLNEPELLDGIKQTLLFSLDKVTSKTLDPDNTHKIDLDSLNVNDPENKVLKSIDQAFEKAGVKKFKMSNDTFNNTIKSTLNEMTKFVDKKGNPVSAQVLNQRLRAVVGLFADIG